MPDNSFYNSGDCSVSINYFKIRRYKGKNLVSLAIACRRQRASTSLLQGLKGPPQASESEKKPAESTKAHGPYCLQVPHAGSVGGLSQGV